MERRDFDNRVFDHAGLNDREIGVTFLCRTQKIVVLFIDERITNFHVTSCEAKKK